jgi:hypothetical protein
VLVVEELVDVDELVDVLLDVDELVDVLLLVEVDELVDVDELVEVDVEVVPQLLVHESVSSALPSSHASPDVICTMPSPHSVHGLVPPGARHAWPLSGQPTCNPPPQMFGLPPGRTAGQHWPVTPGAPGTDPVGMTSHVSNV